MQSRDLPDSRKDLLTPCGSLVLLATANKQVLILCLTPFNLQELIKLQHPPLAARITLASLMEYRHARMVDALLPITRCALAVFGIASPPPAFLAIWDLEARIVVFGIWRRWRWGRSMLGWLNWVACRSGGG